jgi:hypothetical protein
MEHSGADHATRIRIQCDEREQAPCFGEGRQLAEVGDELVAAEGREVAGIAELRVAERRQKPVDVLELGKSKPDVATRMPSGGPRGEAALPSRRSCYVVWCRCSSSMRWIRRPSRPVRVKK